jgi:RNA polymerase sigma factor (TIGR02999 family)
MSAFTDRRAGAPSGLPGDTDPPPGTFTGDGDPPSSEQLLPRLYEQLRAIAHRQLGRYPRGGTLETGELVHEAYLRVVSGVPGERPDEAHFLALTSVAMRHVLVDRARARGRLKRGGGRGRVTFDENRIAVEDQPEALLRLDEALTWLSGVQPRLARVVECRFFGGLSEEEIAKALGVTVRTVQRDWAKARMLLRRAMEP